MAATGKVRYRLMLTLPVDPDFDLDDAPDGIDIEEALRAYWPQEVERSGWTFDAVKFEPKAKVER